MSYISIHPKRLGPGYIRIHPERSAPDRSNEIFLEDVCLSPVSLLEPEKKSFSNEVIDTFNEDNNVMFLKYLELLEENKTGLKDLLVVHHEPDADLYNPYNFKTGLDPLSTYMKRRLYQNLKSSFADRINIQDLNREAWKEYKEWSYHSFYLLEHNPCIHWGAYRNSPMFVAACGLPKSEVFGTEIGMLRNFFYTSLANFKWKLLASDKPKIKETYEALNEQATRLCVAMEDTFRENADTAGAIYYGEQSERKLAEYSGLYNETAINHDSYEDLIENQLNLLSDDLTVDLSEDEIETRRAMFYQKLQIDKQKTMMEIWDEASKEAICLLEEKHGFTPLPSKRDVRRRVPVVFGMPYMQFRQLRRHTNPYNWKPNPKNYHNGRLFTLYFRMYGLTLNTYYKYFNDFEAKSPGYGILLQEFQEYSNYNTKRGAWNLRNLTFNPWHDRFAGLPSSIYGHTFDELDSTDAFSHILEKIKVFDKKYNITRQHIAQALDEVSQLELNKKRLHLGLKLKNDEGFNLLKSSFSTTAKLPPEKETLKQKYFIPTEFDRLLLVLHDSRLDDVQKRLISQLWNPVARRFQIGLIPKPFTWFLIRYYAKLLDAIHLNDKVIPCYYRRIQHEFLKSLALGGPTNVNPDGRFPPEYHFIWDFVRRRYIKQLPFTIYGIASYKELAESLSTNKSLPQFDTDQLKINSKVAQEALLARIQDYSKAFSDEPTVIGKYKQQPIIFNENPFYFKGNAAVDLNEMVGTINFEKVPSQVRYELIENKVLDSLVPSVTFGQTRKGLDLLGTDFTPHNMHPIVFFNSLHDYKYPKYEEAPSWRPHTISNWLNPYTGKVNNFSYLQEIYDECGLQLELPFGFTFGHEIVLLISFLVFATSVPLVYMIETKWIKRCFKILAFISGSIYILHRLFPMFL